MKRSREEAREEIDVDSDDDAAHIAIPPAADSQPQADGSELRMSSPCRYHRTEPPSSGTLVAFFAVKPQKSVSERRQRIAHTQIEVFNAGVELLHKRSRFLAHVAFGASICAASVKDIVAELASDYMLSHAAHPAMYACRLASSDGVCVADVCDDNGEPGGSRAILSVLRNYNIRNVLVVVTRFFGGILLGPVRFDHIRRVTTLALSQTGRMPL